MEDEDDPEMWVALDASFHATIAAASGNGVFERVVNDIREAMVNQSETINLITGRQHPSHAEHREILAAIEAGDGPAAGRAMAAHLAAVDEALTLILGAETRMNLTDFPAHAPLAVQTRGELVESVHYGSLVALDGRRPTWCSPAGSPAPASTRARP